MKVLIDEATGDDLDAAVGIALGLTKETALKGARGGIFFETWRVALDTGPPCDDSHIFEPSRLWAHGGPIIEAEGIELWRWAGDDGTYWLANVGGRSPLAEPHGTGATPLIAAMRAFVRMRLGDEVEL